MNLRAAWWLALCAAACTSDPASDDADTDVADTDTDASDTDPSDTDVAAATGVLRDCAPTPGTICPFAGASRNGFNGEGKDRLEAWFSFPMSITFSPYGLPTIADWNNHKIRQIQEDGTLVTIMGTSFLGDGDAALADLTPAGAPGTEVNLNHPTQQIFREDGVMISASWHTHKLRTWDPTTGLVHVYLGNLPGFSEPAGATPGERYPAAGAQLNQPRQVLQDANGDLLILDMRNERIRKLHVETWEIQTIAGSGAKSYCGEGDALSTCFNFPKNANPEPGGAMALSADGETLYIADTESHVLRALDLVTGETSLLAGAAGEAGDVDATGAAARFSYPAALALDGDTLFVADANNHKIRAVDVTTGAVTTFAGTGEPTCPLVSGLLVPEMCDAQARSGDGGPAVDAQLYRPFGVDLDLDGNLVVADTYNHRFRIIYR